MGLIRVSSAYCLGLIWVSSGYHQRIIGVSSETHNGRIRVSPGSHPSLIRVSSESHPGIIRVSSVYHQGIIRVSSGARSGRIRVSPSLIRVSSGPHRGLFRIVTRMTCFSAGERLRDTYVISRSVGTCLIVPHLVFWRHGHMTTLLKMRDELEASVPRESDLSRLYWEAGRWQRYKRHITNEVRQRKRIPNPTTIEDVPRSLREDVGEFVTLARSGNERADAK